MYKHKERVGGLVYQLSTTAKCSEEPISLREMGSCDFKSLSKEDLEFLQMLVDGLNFN